MKITISNSESYGKRIWDDTQKVNGNEVTITMDASDFLRFLDELPKETATAIAKQLGYTDVRDLIDFNCDSDDVPCWL